MSQILIEDAGWSAIMADPELQRARSKLSFHEIRLIVNHARAFRKHDFWGAGEPDCPSEIKAGNGELHTLRCKVCGKDNPRDDRCLTSPAVVEGPEVDLSHHRPKAVCGYCRAEYDTFEEAKACSWKRHGELSPEDRAALLVTDKTGKQDKDENSGQ